jgi:hypothetical protein
LRSREPSGGLRGRFVVREALVDGVSRFDDFAAVDDVVARHRTRFFVAQGHPSGVFLRDFIKPCQPTLSDKAPSGRLRNIGWRRNRRPALRCAEIIIVAAVQRTTLRQCVTVLSSFVWGVL